MKESIPNHSDDRQSKIIALDVGEKTIGCAVVGEDGIAPEPLSAIIRRNGALSLGPLRRLFRTYQVGILVIGLPLKRGQSSHQSRKVNGFISKLKKHFPDMTIVVQDETLSTWSAERNFSRLKLKKSSRPINIDSFAAREILVSYLDRRTNRSK